MGRAGRKRKAGRRTPADTRPSRAGLPPPFDRGTERTQAMQALYGPDGSDAIGRAYRAGLLGEGSEAKALLDLARNIAKAYWIAYATGRYQCPLADRTFGSVVSLDAEKVKRREQWLSGCLDAVQKLGVRQAFDQLVIDVNPDHGPAWLDSLISAKRNAQEPNPFDARVMRAALDALDALAA